MAGEMSEYLQHAAIVDANHNEPETRDLPYDLAHRSPEEEVEQPDIM